MGTASEPAREIHVAVAVVRRDDAVLIARRPDHVHQGGLLEFPGGKVEPGETVQRALVRELAEETGLRVPEASLEPVIGIRHDYGDKRVFLDVWQTREAEGTAHGREGQSVEWMSPDQLRDTDFPAANRPIIRALRLPTLLAFTGPVTRIAEAGERLYTAVSGCPSSTIVLRAPALDGGDYLELAKMAIAQCRQTDQQLIVHGEPERFAQVPGAAGLHLPWREAARLSTRPIPEGAWLGVSCHDPEQIEHAVNLGADYVTLGPVKPTASHPEAEGLGWQCFRDWVAKAPVPVFGLGGLAPDDVFEARQAGAQGIAGIGFWWSV